MHIRCGILSAARRKDLGCSPPPRSYPVFVSLTSHVRPRVASGTGPGTRDTTASPRFHPADHAARPDPPVLAPPWTPADPDPYREALLWRTARGLYRGWTGIR